MNKDEYGCCIWHRLVVDGSSHGVTLPQDDDDATCADNLEASPFMLAALMGKSSFLLQLLNSTNSRVLLDARDAGSCTPLLLACREGNRCCADVLVNAGSDINAVNLLSETPVFVAAAEGHSEVVAMLLRSGADATRLNMQQRSALHAAAQSGHSAVVKQLLQWSCSQQFIDAQDETGLTPLMLSSQFGDACAVSALLHFGADVSVADNTQQTALHFASRCGHVDVADAILCVLPSAVRRVDKGGSTPLHRAALHGQVEFCRRLLEVQSEAPLEVEDSSGMTAVLVACQQGHLDCVKVLDAFGCSLRSEDALGRDACHLAASAGAVDLLRFLTERAPFALHSRSVLGSSAIHKACAGGHVECVRILLLCAPDLVDAQDAQGRTPLHFACERKNLCMIRLLLQFSADVTVADRRGQLPVARLSPSLPLESPEWKDVISLLTNI